MLIVTLAIVLTTYSGPVLRTSGGNDGVEVPFTPAVQVKGDLTLEAWIRPETADVGGPFHFIVSQNYEGRGYALVLIGRGNDVRLQFEANDTLRYAIPMAVLRRNWWHVAGVLENGKRMRLYLNGVLVADKETSHRIEPCTRPITIGTSPWDGFTGDIGEVRIWNVARAQEEIVRDMGRRLTGKEPDLLADWDFRHTSRNQVFDLTHHTKPGVLKGKARVVRASSRRA